MSRRATRDVSKSGRFRCGALIVVSIIATDKYALDKGRRNFEAHYGIDLNAVIARLTQKPQLSIQNGKYVAQLEGEEYVAGPITIGPREAARRTLQFFRECYIENSRRRKAVEVRAS